MGKKSGSPKGDATSAQVRLEDDESLPVYVTSDEEAPGEVEAEPAVEKRPVEEWRKRLFPPSPRGRLHPELYRHAVAAARHHWAACEHHTGSPMRLSQADYRAALEAAGRTAKSKSPRVHDAALFTLAPQER